MKKSIILLISLFGILSLAGCANDDGRPNRGPKPRRDSSAGTLPWNAPASWEGGMPGMSSGGVGTQNNNY